MQPIKQQSGLAIITVLLIVALMVTLLGFLLEQQHLLMRRLTNQGIAEQGFQLATGVDEWAARVLFEDNDRVIDYDGDDWARFGDPEEDDAPEQSTAFSLDPSIRQEAEPLPIVDFGVEGLSYRIEDLQGRFNLNNLATKNEPVRKTQETVLFNLFGLLEIGGFDEREQLVAALVDWLDENDLEVANGVESTDYQSFATPYFAADQMLSSLGELRYVSGYTDEIITQLLPYVTVLPVDNARLNINSVSPEVMTALSGRRVELDTGSVLAFLAERDAEAFLGFSPDRIQDAQGAIIGSVPFEGSFVNNMLQTNSQFFQVTTRVELGAYQFCSYSVMFRENPSGANQSTPKVSVLHRYYNTICDEIIR